MFSRARSGLWHGLEALSLEAGDVVLVPDYNHGSEVEALVRAGIQCRFYEVTGSLEPDERRLKSLLGPDVRALYLIHYFGIPQDAVRWRAWCDQHELFLIEDAAMAFLSSSEGRPIGSFGNLSIFCLYKTFGLPDGGAVVCSEPLPPITGARRKGLGPVATRHGSWLAQRSTLFATAHAALGGDKEYEPGEDFDLLDINEPASHATTRLIGKIAQPQAAQRRRDNFHRLHRELAGHVRPLFEEIPDGSSPVAYMFLADRIEQNRLRATLDRHGVRLANFWLVPHPSLPDGGSDRSRTLRSNVVGLPVHQELRIEDLELIVSAAKNA